jgi:CDGSH-type Zn-finger protein
VSDDAASSPDIVLCPEGPMLVRGRVVIRDEQGTEHHSTRPVSAVCRCGHSAIAPWCDGTHKVVVPRDRS